jgi:hypothetical protein
VHILVELRLGHDSTEDKVYNEGKYIYRDRFSTVGITTHSWGRTGSASLQPPGNYSLDLAVTDEEWCHPQNNYEREVERWKIFWNEVALSNG